MGNVMLNNNTLIKNLEDYKDTEKYSTRQLAEFLSNTEGLKDFYQEHIDKISEYIKKYPRLIVKFSKDINCFYPHLESAH